MNSITDWIKYELYPTLFDHIDRAFPEHQFTRFSGGWKSRTYLNGAPHKRSDKTVVSKSAFGYIIEQGGDVVGLVDYVMRRDRKEFIDAVRTLADVAGVRLPSNTEFDSHNYQKHKDKITLLEDCNSYFIFCLENATGAAEVREYLASRGYSYDDVKAMELGYIPSQEKLVDYLIKKGYTQSIIEETLKLNRAIGDTHKLTIPYRSGSSLKGFKFRTIGDTVPKYLNSTGLDKDGGFFNLSGLKGDKDVVIVEGELDSLHATIKGIHNVVATGGSTISTEQVRDAVKRGAKSFSICFDVEPQQHERTFTNINTAIEVILGEGVNKVYIVTMPDLGNGKTDPDRYIKECGEEAFQCAVDDAIPYYHYLLHNILVKYSSIEKARDSRLTDKEIDDLQDEIVETSVKIPDVIDRERFKNSFLSLNSFRNLGITEESFAITIERLTTTQNKDAQDKALRKLLTVATNLHSKGETDEALSKLEEGIKDVKSKTGAGLLPPLLSFDALLNEIATIPPAYKTGYPSLDKFVGFSPGAITLIAGRPSHGKTTVMFNLLLQMSKLYHNENFYFFTYEEPVKNLSVKLLNRLIGTDLSGYFREYPSLAKPTNYEFLKTYIRDGRTDLGEVEEGKRLLGELIDSRKITVIDRNYSVEELNSLIAYLNKKERIGGIFIDYIQRMRTERKTQDKRTEIAHISDQVLQIAKESGLPIILGAQLNRATLTSGTNKKPALENLKEAGNLEEDANTVLSVYNESREKEDSPEGDSYKGLRVVDLEFKTLKNREGEVNQTATLSFDKWTGLILDTSGASVKNFFK